MAEIVQAMELSVRIPPAMAAATAPGAAAPPVAAVPARAAAVAAYVPTALPTVARPPAVRFAHSEKHTIVRPPSGHVVVVLGGHVLGTDADDLEHVLDGLV